MIVLKPPSTVDNADRDFLKEVIEESKHSLMDDRAFDLNNLLSKIYSGAASKTPVAFIVYKDGQRIGYVSAIVDVFDIAWIESAAAVGYRNFFSSRAALYSYCKYLFETVGVHKIKCQIPMFEKGKMSAPEAVAKSIGFRKEGMGISEFLKDNRYYDFLELGLFPSYLIKERKRYVVREKLTTKRGEGRRA